MSESTAAAPAGRRWLRISLISVAAAVVLGYAAFKVLQYRSDGPLNAMVPGGPLRAGELVARTDIDWARELGAAARCDDDDCPYDPVELQLENPPLSRYTGIMVHAGELYVPCDLGYMWGRFDGTQRRVLQLIYLFKTWHQDALADGRAVLRINGRRYERQAVRVTDPARVDALKRQLEDMARVWVAPEPLAPAPTDGPRDIWFFRMDPRSEA